MTVPRDRNQEATGTLIPTDNRSKEGRCPDESWSSP